MGPLLGFESTDGTNVHVPWAQASDPESAKSLTASAERYPMCGIIGILGHPLTQVASSIYDGMLVLQHRGQDAAGIVTSDSENIYHRRANGLVRDVFRAKHMSNLLGHMGMGHVRYPLSLIHI